MSQASLIAIEDFLIPSTRIFHQFGLKMAKNAREPGCHRKVFGISATLCLLIIAAQGIVFIHVHKSDGKYLMAIIFDLSCYAIIILGYIKAFVVCIVFKKIVIEVIDDLSRVFPESNHGQEKLEVAKYLRKFNIQISIYRILMPMLIAAFSVSPIIISAFKFLFISGNFDRKLPYFLWFPYGLSGSEPIVFEISYAVSVFGASFCIFMVMAVDLLFCSILTLVSMQFEMLSKKFEAFDCRESKDQLSVLIKEHYQLLR